MGYRIAAGNAVTVEKLITMGATWSQNDVLQTEQIMSALTPERAQEIFANDFEQYQRLNPEPHFDRFTHALVAMWLDKTERGHPDERVQEITAKTLLIRGDNDFLVSLDSLTALQGKIHGASFMNVPFAEHAVYEEQPEVLETILTQFLSQ